MKAFVVAMVMMMRAESILRARSAARAESARDAGKLAEREREAHGAPGGARARRGCGRTRRARAERTGDAAGGRRTDSVWKVF